MNKIIIKNKDIIILQLLLYNLISLIHCLINLKIILMKNNSDDENFDFLYKIIIVGDVNVGKTSLFDYYTSRDSENKPTMVPFMKKKYISFEDKTIAIHIWDTCGMECYRSIVDSFYENAKGAFVVYDITNEQSFNSVDEWIGKLSEIDPIITILGNKCDLVDRKISKDEGNKIAAKYKAKFFEISCINKTNLDQAFYDLVYSIYSKYKDDDNIDFIIFKNNSFTIEKKNTFMIGGAKTNSEARKTVELCC